MRRSGAALARTAPLRALDRFYIPEASRIELQQLLWDAAARDAAHLEIAVDRAGQPAIRRLLVDGVELLEAEAPPRPVDPGDPDAPTP